MLLNFFLTVWGCCYSSCRGKCILEGEKQEKLDCSPFSPKHSSTAFKRVLYAHLDSLFASSMCILSEKQTNFLIFSGEIKLLRIAKREEDENQPNCMQENILKTFLLMLFDKLTSSFMCLSDYEPTSTSFDQENFSIQYYFAIYDETERDFLVVEKYSCGRWLKKFYGI